MHEGIRYVTDERGNKLAVQIDLSKHRAVWEDFQDVLVAESRRGEKSVSLDRSKASLINPAKKLPSYDIRFKTSARRELTALGDSITLRVLEKIEALANEPRPNGCKKLRGAKDLWRVRVGDYRIV